VGLAEDLGYRHSRANAGQRAVQSFASTRPGAWIFSQTLRHIDRLVARVSGGRTSAPALLAGLPVLELTTTGRRSGLRRTTHLIAVPYGDTLALLATNFGGPTTPAWALNLEADPRATVTHRGISREVTARAATPEERAAVLEGSADVYGGYLKYQQRITGRRLRIFVIEPA
jgi:deazaflavin-dependent oxidoreductase (nitroreductase family)